MLQLTYEGETTLVDINEPPVQNDDTPEYARIGLTPLMMTCKAGNYELADMLISEGADINKCTGQLAENALLMACRGMAAPDFEVWKDQEHARVINLLLLNEADVNHADTSGWYPVRWAVFHGSVEMYNSLMEENPIITKDQKVDLLGMAREKTHYNLLVIEAHS